MLSLIQVFKRIWNGSLYCFCFSCVHPLEMDSLFVNINIKFCSMTGSFIEHLNGKIDKGEIPELQVYPKETSDSDHNIDVVDPVIPSVQGEADGLPDGHRPIAVDKPTEVI